MIQKDFKFQLRMTLPTLLVLVAAAGWKYKLGDREPENRVERAIEIMGRTGLSAQEEAELTAGYYEGLLDGAQQTARTRRGLLSNLAMLKTPPPDWLNFSETAGVRWRNDFLRYDIQPGVDIPLKGDRLVANRWGQRDIDYEKKRPPNTRRLALVGSSISFGSCIAMDAGYEALLEARLNAEPPCNSGLRYEIMNFSVPGYMITQLMDMAIEITPDFEPQAVFFVLNYLAFGPEWSSHIATLVRDGHDLKYDFLKEFAEKARLRQSDTASRIASKLAPYRLDVIEACIRETKRRLDEKGIETVILIVPFPAQRDLLKRQTREVLKRVSDLDLPVLDGVAAFGTRPIEELRAREWDNHPNELGHRLIFEVLDEQIRTQPRLRRVIGGCTD